LFKNEWRSHWTAFWNDSNDKTWDVRNGIIWNYAIESAFDTGRIAVYEENDILKWHILDPSLNKVKLAEELMGTNERRIVARPIFQGMTFADLEAKPLVFLNDNRPFRRCLCLHAQVTRLAAVERGWKGAQDWAVESYYTRDDLDLNVAHFLSQISTITISARGSIESLPDNPTNDTIFARAEKLIARRKFF